MATGGGGAPALRSLVGRNLAPVAVHRRLLIGSLAFALVASVGIGYGISGSDDDDTSTSADDDITMTSAGAVQDPTIGTNAAVTGTPLPVVDIEDNNGNTISTGDLIGQPLIVNLWFSTCGPCKKELPEFAAVHADLGDEIRFVGINPSADSPETNQEFAHERGVTYELLRDPNGAFTDEVGVTEFPVTLFVRVDGTIARQTGALDEDTLRRYAQELLG